MVGAGFDMARLTTQTCLPSGCICQQIQLRKPKTPEGILVFRVLVQVCRDHEEQVFLMNFFLSDRREKTFDDLFTRLNGVHPPAGSFTSDTI